jgi:hypothetical protein
VVRPAPSGMNSCGTGVATVSVGSIPNGITI